MYWIYFLGKKWCTLFARGRMVDARHVRAELLSGKIHFLGCHIALDAFNIGKLLTVARLELFHFDRRLSHTRIFRIRFNRRWIYYWTLNIEEKKSNFSSSHFLGFFFFYYFRQFVVSCRTQSACCVLWLTIRGSNEIVHFTTTTEWAQIWMRTIFHLFFVWMFYWLSAPCSLLCDILVDSKWLQAS